MVVAVTKKHPADTFAARHPATASALIVVAVFGSAFLFFWLLAGRPGLSSW